nr:MAG TPA: helix-turn-helix domain protein [Caudoviricetes sp.]
MIYVETAVAAEIFGIHPRALANSINRGSAKYPFIKISDAGTRSRGGAKLLFAVEIADIDAAIKSGKADKDVSVYVEDSSEQNGFRQMKFSEIKGGGKNKEGASKKENFGGEYAVLDDSEKDEINKKIRVLKEYEEAKKRGVSCKKFCEDSGISEANLFRWQKAYKEKGAVALIDKRGKHRKNASVLEEWMIEFLLQNFRAYGAGGVNIAELNRRLHQEYFKRIGEVYNYPKYLMGEIKPLFSDGVIKRFLDSYYQTHKLEYIMVTKGEDKAKSYFQPALGNQGEMITRRNQCWQIDSSPLDMMVRDGEKGEAMRANILSIVDVWQA